MESRSCRLLLFCLPFWFVRVAIAQDDQPPADSPADPVVVERFQFTDTSGEAREVLARLVLTAADGGVLVEDRAGTLWNITPDRLKSRTATQTPYTRFTVDERRAAIRDEFGDAFRSITTPHYIIVFNTTDAYAEWCGGLLERFYEGYFDFWNKAGLKLHEPADRLVVIVLQNQTQFQEFYSSDVGQKTQSSFGYYSIRRNHTVLYNFAETDEAKQTAIGIRRAVAKTPFNVATVVHEATHQLGFNTGLHTRYADNPVWLTEGVAMFFETPDLRTRGWKTIGRINDWRSRSLKAYSGALDAGSVRALVQSDDRFRKAETAGDAYTEAWALTLYLMKRREEDFVRYLQHISSKSPMVWDKADARLAEFTDAFGDPADFEKRMQAYLRKYRR